MRMSWELRSKVDVDVFYSFYRSVDLPSFFYGSEKNIKVRGKTGTSKRDHLR